MIILYLGQKIQSRKMQKASYLQEFLLKCKQKAKINELQQLLIEDSKKFPPPLFSEYEIMVSQYVAAFSEDAVTNLILKRSKQLSVSILFGAYQKLIEKQDYIHALQMLQNFKPCSNENRHIFLYNIAKLHTLLHNQTKAIFHYEVLLKEEKANFQIGYYDYLQCLIASNREAQAQQFVRKVLIKDQENWPLLQNLYLQFLRKKSNKYIINELHQVFHGRKISLLTSFNLALIIRKFNKVEALNLLDKIQQKAHGNILIKTKITIVNLREEFWLDKSSDYNEKKHQLSQRKKFLELQFQTLTQLLSIIENTQIQTKIQQIKKEKKIIDSKLRQQNKKYQSKENEKIIQKKLTANNALTFILRNQTTNPSTRKSKMLKHRNFSQFAFRSTEVKKKNNNLKFLLNKQRQLNDFFKRLRIYKKGANYEVQLINKTIFGRVLKGKKVTSNQNIQKQFDEKMKGFQMAYEGNTEKLLHQFFQNYTLLQKQNSKNFVIRSQKRSVREIKSSRLNQEQLEDKSLKIQKYSSKKIIDNFKEFSLKNISQKQIKEAKKTFEDQLKIGAKLQSQGQMQNAHNHFADMYKRYKNTQEKQKILMKIANNFELQDFDEEAEKTYLKCTKFNIAQAFYRLGNLQIKNGRIQIGVQNLEKANCLQRQNISIQMKLVYGYSLLDQTANRALSLASTILQRNPQSLQALIMTTKVLEKQGKVKQALEIALAISAVKTSTTLDHYIGILYLHDSNVGEAFKYFQKALNQKPDHVPSLIEIATIISDVQPEQSVPILIKVTELDPENQLAWTRLGKIYESQHEYNHAIKAYMRSLEIQPNYQSYMKIGDCLFHEQLYADALHSYRQALALKKTSIIYQKLALVHQKQGHLKKASDSYILAIQILPEDNTGFQEKKRLMFEIGKIALTLQEYDQAQLYLTEVIEMQEAFQPLKMLGQAYYGKGQFQEALQCYRQAHNQIQGENTQLLESIASCFDKMEEYLASKEIYEKILLDDPLNINCMNNLANIFLIIGNTNEAFYYFQQMLNEVPQNIDKRLRVVDIYATIGDWSKVQQHLMICYRQRQTDIRVLERMLNLYKQKRETKQIAKFEKKINFMKQNKRS